MNRRLQAAVVQQRFAEGHARNRAAVLRRFDPEPECDCERRAFQRFEKGSAIVGAHHFTRFDSASLKANATACAGELARSIPLISLHAPSATIGRSSFSANPISLSVPPSPASAITASLLATTIKLRASPRPVATGNSMNSLAESGLFPGRIPI